MNGGCLRPAREGETIVDRTRTHTHVAVVVISI